MDYIKVVKVTKEGKVQEKEIPNTLESLQKEVQGYIEPLPIEIKEGKNIIIIMDEEGRLRNDLPTLFIAPEPRDKTYQIPIYGDILITAHDEEGEMASLTQAEIEEYKELFSNEIVELK